MAKPAPPRNRSLLFLVFLALIVVIAGIWKLQRLGEPTTPTLAWYFDTESQVRFAAKIGQTPPIEGPSKKRDAQGRGTAVLAHMFACGECGKDEFVGYLETNSPEAIEATKALGRDERKPAATKPASGESQPPVVTPDFSKPPETPLTAALKARESGRYISMGGDYVVWVKRESPEGKRILNALIDRCGGRMPPECYPR